MSASPMASLFRPWAAGKELHQDSTVSTTGVETEVSVSLKNDAKPDEPRVRKPKRVKTKLVDDKVSGFCSSESSAFTVKLPSSSSVNEMCLLERLHAESLGIARFYPESYDVMASELALLNGFMPSPVQMEEYGRLLQLQEQALKGGQGRKQRPKKYRCPHCQVAFSNNGQLKGHVRIHTGERPFKCEEATCGKTFTRNEELTRHKRIHSGLRPYACASCGKRFGRKDHLKKHARTHQPQYHRQAMLVPFLPAFAGPHYNPYVYSV